MNTTPEDAHLIFDGWKDRSSPLRIQLRSFSLLFEGKGHGDPFRRWTRWNLAAIPGALPFRLTDATFRIFRSAGDPDCEHSGGGIGPIRIWACGAAGFGRPPGAGGV